MLVLYAITFHMQHKKNASGVTNDRTRSTKPTNVFHWLEWVTIPRHMDFQSIALEFWRITIG